MGTAYERPWVRGPRPCRAAGLERMALVSFHGHGLQQPAFPDDDGTADPAVTAALAAYDADPAAGHAAALAALQDSRLLVPVVATLGEVEHDEQGLAHDKSSE